MTNAAYLNTTQILWFKGSRLERKSLQGDIKQETYRKHPVLQLAQDKGGPSKGGFLNNIYIYIYICSHTDLYVCNEINGRCLQAIYYSGK